MARPRLPKQQQWTDALKVKQDKELGKLKTALSQQLCQDIQRLYEDTESTDLRISAADGETRCHSCILLARLPHLWPKLNEEGPTKTIHLKNVTLADVKQMVSDVYEVTGPIPEKWQRDTCCENKEEEQNSNSKGNRGTDSDAVSESLTENKSESDEITACCNMAEDLLALNKVGIATDHVLRVDDTEFKVHRALLVHRSEFFQAMLGGAWAESTQATVDLQGISASSLQQMVLYMYGGFSLSTPASSLLELVAAADMYGVQGFKQLLAFRIKADKCHFFHKPCPQCIAGVVEVLPLLFSYGFPELLQKALQWTAKHMVRVWATKEFASLPQEILDKSLAAAIHEISRETVIGTILETDQLLGRLTEVQWSATVRHLGDQLMEACRGCIQHRMEQVLTVYSCTSMAKTMSEWSLAILEDVFKRAIETLPTETACKTYMWLVKLKSWAKAEEETSDAPLGQEFYDFLYSLEEECKNYMIVNVNLLYNTPQWMMLPKDIQQKIRADAYYVSLSDKKVVKSAPKMTPREPKDQSKARVNGEQTKPKTNAKSKPGTAHGGGDSARGNRQASKAVGGACAASCGKISSRRGNPPNHSKDGKHFMTDAAGKSKKVESSGKHDIQNRNDIRGNNMKGGNLLTDRDERHATCSTNLKATCDRGMVVNECVCQTSSGADSIGPLSNGISCLCLPDRGGVDFVSSFVPAVQFIYEEPVCDIYFETNTEVLND